jgi:hypothetical protein
MDERGNGVRFLAGERDIPLFRKVHTGPGAHTAAYSTHREQRYMLQG